jgi:hypothetical protein
LKLKKLNTKTKKGKVLKMVKEKKFIDLMLHAGMEMLGISDIEVVYLKKESFQSPEITAVLNQQTYSIVINEDWMIKANELEISATLFHELRHAYQLAQIEYPMYMKFKESTKRIAIWKKEILGYIAPTTADIHDQAYYSQDIEIDAVAFSNLMIKTLFDKKLIVPEPIFNQVKEREEEMLSFIQKKGNVQFYNHLMERRIK